MMTNFDDQPRRGGAVELSEVRALTKVALWAALIGVGGWLSLPLAGLPMTMQNFFVLLAGLVAGPRIAALAACLYLTAGLLGLPVFAGGTAGPALLLKPSAGFALAFPLGAAVAGLVARSGLSGRPLGWLRSFLAAVIGDCIIWIFGFLGLKINAGLGFSAAVLLFWPLMLGDLVKCVAASLAVARLAKP